MLGYISHNYYELTTVQQYRNGYLIVESTYEDQYVKHHDAILIILFYRVFLIWYNTATVLNSQIYFHVKQGPKYKIIKI